MTPPAPKPSVVMTEEDVAKVRSGLEQIRHSMHQARIPGNDKRREIELTGKLADELLGMLETSPNQKAQP